MLGLLLESPALQEEIGLSEEQKQGLREYSQSMRERQRELFRNLRPAQGGRGGRGQQGPQPFQFDPAQMEQMQQAMAALQSESQTVISKILTPQQLERLEQIRLRIIGPTAVAEEKVARSLMLAPEQFQQVQNIMAEYDLQAVNLMRQNFEAMRGQGGPGGPGAFGGPGGAQNPGNIRGGVAGPGANRGAVGGAPGGAAAAGGGGQDAGDRRAFFNSPQFREMQERMARMAEEEDQLLKRAEAAIAKALTTRQKQQFNRMLGEPFDLTKLVQGPPQGGGRRGQGRDGERPGETPQPAGPATATSAPQPAAAVAGGDAGASAAAPSSGGRTRIPPRVRGFTNDNGR
jgi:DNA-binding TFAR19-related protein (PDSD5 family)